MFMPKKSCLVDVYVCNIFLMDQFNGCLQSTRLYENIGLGLSILQIVFGINDGRFLLFFLLKIFFLLLQELSY